jgi:hypothetical protein
MVLITFLGRNSTGSNQFPANESKQHLPSAFHLNLVIPINFVIDEFFFILTVLIDLV